MNSSLTAEKRIFAVSDWSRPAILRRSLQLLFLAAFLLVPFHEGFFHFVLKGHPFFGSGLVYPEHLLLLALAFFFRAEMAAVVSLWRLELLLVAIHGAAYWGSAFVNEVSLDYAFEYFVVGVVLPVFFLLLLTAATQKFGFEPVRDGLSFLLAGVAIVCAVGVLAYPASFGIPRSFHEFIFDSRTDRALLGAGYGFWYGDFTLGNFNVFASYLLPALYLGYGWYRVQKGLGPFARTLFALGVVLLAANLYICYSRGAFVVLNVSAALLLLLSLRRREWRRGLLPAGVLLVVFDLLVIAPRGAIPYWRSLGEKTASNSAAQRLQQWEGVAEQSLLEGGPGMGIAPVRRAQARRAPPGRLQYLMFGVGVGNYGLGRGLGVDANTHNLFLNQFLVAGLLGFVSFATLFGVVVLRGFQSLRFHGDGYGPLRIASIVGLAAIGGIGTLSQYEFLNLGTMTGATIFWSCAFFARFRPVQRSPAPGA